jgi:hypothetical protein
MRQQTFLGTLKASFFRDDTPSFLDHPARYFLSNKSS